MILDFCCICGKTSDLHNHHIIPRAKGGTEHETNMITLCTKHHTWIHRLKPNTWNNHKNLVIEGQNRAKEQGKHIGRPTNMTQEIFSLVLELRKQGVGIRKLAKEMNIGIDTVYKIINREYSEDYKKGLK